MSKRLTGVSGKDLKKSTSNIPITVDYIKMMTVYDHNRDQAVGLRMSQRTKGMAWFGERKEAQEVKAYTNYFHLGIIKQAQERVKEIKALITADTPLDEAQRLYREAVVLHGEIKKAAQVIHG